LEILIYFSNTAQWSFLYVRNRIDFSTKKQVRDCCKKKVENRIGFVTLPINFVYCTDRNYFDWNPYVYSGDKITVDVESFVNGFEILKPYAHPVAVGLVVVVLTFFLFSFRRMPKRIGLNHPEAIAKAVAP
jgi:hypothetical protein